MAKAPEEHRAQAKKHAVANEDYSEAPPCLRRIIAAGGPKENEQAFYRQAASYLLRKYGAEVAKRPLLNLRDKLGSSLHDAAMEEILKSLGGRWGTRRYRCEEQPCAAFCDRTACMAMVNFGLGSDDADSTPELSEFEKVNYEPHPIWRFKVNGTPVEMFSKDLLDKRAVKAAVLSATGTVWPPASMTQARFEGLIGAHTAEAKDVTPPDDAQPWSVVVELFQNWVNGSVNWGYETDFLRLSSQRIDKNPMTGQESLVWNNSQTRGATYQGGGFDRVVFRIGDFADRVLAMGNYIDRDLKFLLGRHPTRYLLWVLTNKLGVESAKVRLDFGETRDLWVVPAEGIKYERQKTDYSQVGKLPFS